MAIINNIVKISKCNGVLTSEYVENELFKLGYKNILRWAVVSVDDIFMTINFCSF